MFGKYRHFKFLVIIVVIFAITAIVSNIIANPLAAIRSTRVLISIPRTGAEFARVFGRAPSAAENLQALKALGSLQHGKDVIEINSKTDYNRSLKPIDNVPGPIKRLLERDRDVPRGIIMLNPELLPKRWSVTILVGHNQDGYFCFNNGDKVLISELAAKARDKNQILLVISCYSKQYTPEGHFGIKSKISARCAAEIVKHVKEYCDALPCDEILIRKRLKDSLQSILHIPKLFAPHCHIFLKLSLVSSGTLGSYYLLDSY